MRKTAFLLAISLLCAVPLAAQTTEFGVIFGGSKRVIEHATSAAGTELISEGFSFSNNSVDLYYAFQVDPGSFFKVRVGRIEGPVAFREAGGGRHDVRGEVQHVEGVVEYRFSEAFGSTGLYAGVGAYRTEASGMESTTDYGFPIGVTADFPLSRRYGVIVDASFHFTKADFNPRYLTLGAGLRIAF